MPRTEKGDREPAPEPIGRPGLAKADSHLPTNFGRYQVKGLVGEGSIGRVYRAFDPMAQRVVAIKTLKSEYLTSARGQDYFKRFRREAEAAGHLAHPHIITIFDVGEDYFVMELLEGQTLAALLRPTGTFELAEALRILGLVAEGLDHAHSKGIIHRDIKPSNIMLLPDGRPKIMDFGVAHLSFTVITTAGGFPGSPSYVAPEQVTSSKASPRTDLFSLAVVAYEMLTGRRPFEGEGIAQIVHAIVNAEAVSPCSWNPALPRHYDTVFRRALAKDPSVRYPNATAFIAALGRPSADSAVSATGIADSSPPEADGPPLGDVVTHDLKAPPEARESARGAATAPSPAWSHRLPPLVLGALALSATVALLALRGRAPAGPPEESPPSVRTGAIEIATEPVGAQVWVDNTKTGRSPLALSGILPGRHAIRVALPGFSSAELNLDVPAGAFAVPLRFTLQPANAVLQVRSEPDGALVFIDGQPRGTTPIETLSLPPGKHGVELTLKGFAPWVQSVQASAGDRIPLLGRLRPQPGSAPPSAYLRSLGWVHEGDFLEPGPDVTPPRKISGENAPYPDPARKLKLRGTVTVEMTITTWGEPAELRVVESAGETLDDAVLAAVRTWRYTPAEKNGVKVRTRVRVRQTFEGGR
jgi:TonB family protein